MFLKFALEGYIDDVICGTAGTADHMFHASACHPNIQQEAPGIEAA